MINHPRHANMCCTPFRRFLSNINTLTHWTSSAYLGGWRRTFLDGLRSRHRSIERREEWRCSEEVMLEKTEEYDQKDNGNHKEKKTTRNRKMREKIVVDDVILDCTQVSIDFGTHHQQCRQCSQCWAVMMRCRSCFECTSRCWIIPKCPCSNVGLCWLLFAGNQLNARRNREFQYHSDVQLPSLICAYFVKK